jgi:hypothetical protein
MIPLNQFNRLVFVVNALFSVRYELAAMYDLDEFQCSEH